MKPDRDQTLAILARHREHLISHREQLGSKLSQERDKLAELQAEAHRRAQEYRATPQGIAESLRELETAELAGADRATLRTLQRNHIAAEQLSADEYGRRRDRWGHKLGDGPVRGCPAGPLGGMRTQVMRDRVFGSYRHDPAVTAVRVSLFRLTADRRLRTAVTYPLHGESLESGASLDLSTVLAWSFSSGAVSDRILERLQLDPSVWLPLATSQIAAAHARAD